MFVFFFFLIFLMHTEMSQLKEFREFNQLSSGKYCQSVSTSMFVISNFYKRVNDSVSAVRDWLRWIGRRPCGWRVGSPNTLAITLTTHLSQALSCIKWRSVLLSETKSSSLFPPLFTFSPPFLPSPGTHRGSTLNSTFKTTLRNRSNTTVFFIEGLHVSSRAQPSSG